ncbi:hypothetical protein NDU88_000599 [Pleurodeles waltl]|uniref:Uncharacterized protein n=1 Tax=Pleurodeles waltl TaxID=8319 RepID=A0AAV7V9I4_PLEWA|nr:hypothetical protein NDU88_000599 [Pleurodeles waltl]
MFPNYRWSTPLHKWQLQTCGGSCAGHSSGFCTWLLLRGYGGNDGVMVMVMAQSALQSAAVVEETALLVTAGMLIVVTAVIMIVVVGVALAALLVAEAPVVGTLVALTAGAGAKWDEVSSSPS